MDGVYIKAGFALLFLLLLVNVVFLLWLFFSRKSRGGDGNELKLILQQMNELNKTMDSKISETHKSVEGQFRDSQRLIQEINKQVNEQLRDVAKGQSEVAERSNQIFAIAEQLQDLQRTLKSQKERGNFGESSLKLILSNILPPEVYETEYGFSDGTRVDAVIHSPEGIIPIDAKFSLETYTALINAEDEDRKTVLEKQFRDDLKKRIDETSKYIKQSEGTLPFAFMYIPAEGLYYELLVKQVGGSTANNRNMISYAVNDKKVIIVSPTTFYAYLQSVLYGFKAFKIEKNAESIQKNVTRLSRHLNRYGEFFGKLGSSLKTAVNHYDSAEKELNKLDKDVERITGESTDPGTLSDNNSRN
ncbi:MAG: DNA recombination protein RmuC [Candidatus Paceibacterota bacterium]